VFYLFCWSHVANSPYRLATANQISMLLTTQIHDSRKTALQMESAM
jgi:hypothetical protein